jgi:putative acetyltransferase
LVYSKLEKERRLAMIKKLHTVNEKQLAQLLTLWLNSNLDAHAFIDKCYWQEQLPFVKKTLPESELYIYTTNDKILGFIGLMDHYIAGLFVEKSYRNLGIGTKLLHVAKANHEQLTLTVFEKNNKAVKFYLAENFLIEKKQLDAYTNESEFVMTWMQP